MLFVALAPGATLDDDLTAPHRRAPCAASCRPATSRTRSKPSRRCRARLSGKKLEVPVKRILTGTPPDEAASRESLADPTSLDWFAARARLTSEC